MNEANSDQNEAPVPTDLNESSKPEALLKKSEKQTIVSAEMGTVTDIAARLKQLEERFKGTVDLSDELRDMDELVERSEELARTYQQGETNKEEIAA